jgi:hypothetical protein
MAKLRRELEVARNMRRHEVFEIAEDVVCPILSIAYDLPDLENLNISEHPSYPAIDLGDQNAGEAIQVASRVTTPKIKNTLDTFFDHGLHSQYRRLYFLGLYETQKSYPSDRISEHLEAPFDFDPECDVLSMGDLESRIAGIQTQKLSRVVQVLSEELEEGYAVNPRISDKANEEYLLSNLIEVEIPDLVYIGEVAIDRDELIEKTWDLDEIRDLNKYASWSQVIKTALKLDDEPPVNDFLVHGGNLITFHDLNDLEERLTEYVFADSIEEFQSEDYFGQDEDHRRLFSHLLGRCFTQLVYPIGIRFHFDEKQHFFLPKETDDLEPREEEWSSTNASRKVYTPTVGDDGELWYAKHLSFDTRFYYLQDSWHIAISPDWYWSSDGWYQTYSRIGEKRDWIKNHEWNGEVRNHFRFLNEFLTRETSRVLSRRGNAYAYVSLGDVVRIGPAPRLDDGLWESRVESAKEDAEEERTLFNG